MKCAHQNFCKVKSLLFITNQMQPVTLSQISAGTGVSKGSLAVLLGRWTGWDYVKRVPCGNDYGYVIGGKGASYVESLPRWYKHLGEAVAELAELSRIEGSVAWREKDNTFHVLSPPFKTKDDYEVKKEFTGAIIVNKPQSLFGAIDMLGKRYTPEFKAYVLSELAGAVSC